MTIQFFHFNDKFSSYFRSFRFRLMDYDFLGESQLRQLFLDTNTDPLRIDVYF